MKQTAARSNPVRRTPARRDTLITGVGFCLPGDGERPCTGREGFWDTVSRAASHVHRDGIHFGRIGAELPEALADLLPGLPAAYQANYSAVQRYGLVSLGAACADLGLRPGEDTRDSAVLVARVGADAWYDPYADALAADPATVEPRRARRLINRTMLAGGVTDVTSVQAAVLDSTGPQLAGSCGCASSAVLLGVARRMIATGEADLVFVTGADHYEIDRLLHYKALGDVVVPPPGPGAPPPDAEFLVHGPMRPYDRMARGFNVGNGAVTLVLESREGAARAGRAPLCRLTAQATRSAGGTSALAVDTSGAGPVAAIKAVLDGRLDPEAVDYVNGAATGDPVFNRIEAAVMERVFGRRARELPVSVQEACFGHSGAPLGVLGVAVTALSLARGEICPTAGCQDPDDALTFDPVPGTKVRPAGLRHALSINHAMGGVASAVLLEAEHDA